MFCAWSGIVLLCGLLIITAVLRWIAPEETRKRRLNQLAVLAVIVLCFICICAMWSAIASAFVLSSEGDFPAAGLMTVSFGAVKLIIKLVLLGAAFASTLVLVLAILLFLGHGLKAIFDSAVQDDASLEEQLKTVSKRLITIMKSPIMVAVITWGVLALFFTIPFLTGDSSAGNLKDVWKSGVEEIVEFGSHTEEHSDNANALQQNTDTPETTNLPSSQTGAPNPEGTASANSNSESNSSEDFYQALIKYILLSVIVLGVAFAVFKLLYSIILRTFAEIGSKDILNEYSSAIGVLSVGVAMLWTLQNNKLDLLSDPVNLLLEFVKAFVIVMLIVALIILTLEIIRLLLDIQQILIWQEAALLFTSLVGHITLLVFSMLNSMYDAVNNAIGYPDDESLEEIRQEMKLRILQTMDEQLTKRKTGERTYAASAAIQSILLALSMNLPKSLFKIF